MNHQHGQKDSAESSTLSEEDARIKAVYAQGGNAMYQRFSGVSTRIAIKAVAEALENPGKPIKIKDHYAGKMGSSHVTKIAMSILDLLGVDYRGAVANCEITVEPLLPELHYERKFLQMYPPANPSKRP